MNTKYLLAITAWAALLTAIVEAGDLHDYQVCVVGTDLCVGKDS